MEGGAEDDAEGGCEVVVDVLGADRTVGEGRSRRLRGARLVVALEPALGCSNMLLDAREGTKDAAATENASLNTMISSGANRE